jgi:transcription initiation factor TFIID subunit 7
VLAFGGTLQHLKNPLLTIIESFKPPVDADGKVNGESKGDMNEEALKRRPEIQIQRERVTELEGLIAQESAKHEMQTNKILK